jgi:hypothetical protein
MTHWFVIIMFALSIVGLVHRIYETTKSRRGYKSQWTTKPNFSLGGGLALFCLAGFTGALVMALGWDFGARLVPEIIAIAGVTFSFLLLVMELLHEGLVLAESAGGESTQTIANVGAAMDLAGGYGDLSDRVIYWRAFGYFCWAWSVLLVGWVLGLLPALAIFLFSFMYFHGRERLLTALVGSCSVFGVIWLVFDYIANDPWPQSVIGDTFPVLRTILPWF